MKILENQEESDDESISDIIDQDNQISQLTRQIEKLAIEKTEQYLTSIRDETIEKFKLDIMKQLINKLK